MTATDTILQAIGRAKATRETIALDYRRGLLFCSTRNDTTLVDWPAVNRAILTKYSMAGLKYIKREAWRV